MSSALTVGIRSRRLPRHTGPLFCTHTSLLRIFNPASPNKYLDMKHFISKVLDTHAFSCPICCSSRRRNMFSYENKNLNIFAHQSLDLRKKQLIAVQSRVKPEHTGKFVVHNFKSIQYFEINNCVQPNPRCIRICLGSSMCFFVAYFEYTFILQA